MLLFVVFAAIGTGKVSADKPSIPVKTLSDSSISKPAYSESLIAGYGEYAVYPVKATATGKMYIDVKTPDTNVYGISSAIGTFDGSQLSYYENRTGYCSKGSTETGVGCYDVVKGKTYYVGLKRISSTDYDTAQVRAYIIPYSNNRLLKAQSKYLIASCVKGSDNKNTSLYYKIKPTKTGVINVTLKNYGSSSSSGYITLYNGSKKVRSEKLYFSSSSDSYKVRFGVKKGNTYYLKMTDTYGNSKYNYKYGIKYSITAVTDRSISKKANAKTLTRKATATSTLFTANGTTETDWYKFKVTSKRETVLSVDASQMRGSDQKLTITVYKGSTKVASTTLWAGSSNKYTVTYGSTYGKANAGTYYVKITKTSKLSGKYKIRYVK